MNPQDQQQFLKKHRMFLEKFQFPDNAREKMLSLLAERELSFVPLSVSNGWEPFDRAIFETISPLITQYKENYDCNFIQKDHGYYLGQLNEEQTEHNNAANIIGDTVQKSCFPVAAVMFLESTSKATIAFPDAGVRFEIKNNYCLFFPSNWIYKPVIELNNSKVTFICTFLGCQ